MKRIFLSVAAMLLVISLPAQNKKEAIVKKIKTSANITSLLINDDVQVVLMNENGTEIFIEGQPAAVEKVVLTEKDGELAIGRMTFFTRPVVVCVPANFISRVEINGDSKVVSYQLLPVTKLDVIINGHCHLFIKTTGRINVTAGQDYNFTGKIFPAKS
jgi:hypothetical protein